MPSQQQTGSDTRMYSPRSESNLGYTNDDDSYQYGKGDPELAEQERDKKQAEKDAQKDTTDLPHLQFSVPKPEPKMPPMMPGMEEEEDPMADQYQEGNQLSAMTGMPDMGNLSIGAATGTMPQPGGTLMTGEPMEHAWSSLLKEEGEEGEEEEEDDAVPDNKFNRKPPPLDLDAQYNRYRRLADKNVVEMTPTDKFPPTAHGNPDYYTRSEPMEDAWSSLMKSRLDRAGRSKDKSWKQPMYEIAAGGSQQETATPRRAKMQSRYMQPAKKHGLDKSPLSVHRTHLGIATKQPQRLFPRDYGQQMGTQARRKLMGNVPQIPAGHAMGPETSYSPRVPKVGNAAGLPIKEPRAPAMRGGAFAKSDSLEDIRKDLNQINKKMSEYMHFAQIRRLLRRLKDAAERQESRLKAAASSEPGQNREAGHREGNKTTKPEGGTENLEDDPKNWGAPSTLFAARGSGRTA